MADTIRIKRRTSGAAGPPGSLASAELAYNAIGDVLYIGKGDDGTGQATSVVPVGGAGAFASDSDLAGLAPIASPAFTGNPTAPTPTAGDADTSVATTGFVSAAIAAAGGGGPYQPLDPDLTSLAAASLVDRIYYRSAANTWTAVVTGGNLTFSGGILNAVVGEAATDGNVYGRQSGGWALLSSIFEQTSRKGAANGYASLDATAKVPAAQLPSYVDDVLEYANLAAFPATGATGVIYVALDTGKIYRWSGSAYVEISPSPGSTDAVPEGSVNLYYTEARVSANATVTSKAPLASPIFTGDPRAPTPTAGDADTSIATTQFVASAISTAGGSYQPLDAELTALAGLASTADRVPYFTGSGTAALATFTSFGRTLVDDADASTALSTLGVSAFAKTILDDADAATVRTTIGAQAAGNYQPLDADLTSLAALGGTGIYYRSAADTWSLVTIGTGLTFTSGTLSATASGGNVSNVGTPVANQVGVWTGATTIKGDANLVWTGSILQAFSSFQTYSGSGLTGDGAQLSAAAAQGRLSAVGSSSDVSLILTSKGNASVTIYNAAFGRTVAQFGSAAGSDTILAVTAFSGYTQITTNPTNKRIDLQGTPTNDNAPAGFVGEFLGGITSNNSSGLAGATWFNGTSVSLTPGDWDVSIGMVFQAAVGLECYLGIGTASGTPTSQAGWMTSDTIAPNGDCYACAGPVRISVSVTTGAYCIGWCAGTWTMVSSYIRARRVR